MYKLIRRIALLGVLMVGLLWTVGCSTRPQQGQELTPDGGTNSSLPDGASNNTSPDGSSGSPCVGVDPAKAPGDWNPQVPSECQGKPGNCVGTPMPEWKLKDFQPQSCGFGKTYGGRAFRGKVTLVALLAAWCGFCQAQIEKLERMRLELAAQGKDVHFIVINGSDAEPQQQEFVKRAAIPLFQDTPTANVWGLMGGAKDDMYIFNSQGHLAVFLPFQGSVDINLSTEAGYDNLKKAILGVK